MEKPKSYLGLFIITPEKEETISEVKAIIVSIIKENSGNIVKETEAVKKALAYPIRKKSVGLYYEVIFTAAPESVAGMMKQFRINTNILRTLIDKVNEKAA